MDVYRLPGLNLEIDAHPEQLNRALVDYFSLCPRTGAVAELCLHARGMARSRLELEIPDWILKQIRAMKENEEPGFLRGPQNEYAVVSTYGGTVFCAYSLCGSKRINVICELQPNGVSVGMLPGVIVPLLREHMLTHRRLLLHAGAASTPNGAGLCFIAISGQGKTTTTLSVVRRGAHLLADDLVALHVDGEGVIAQGIPKRLNLRAGTISFFDELQSSIERNRLTTTLTGRVTIAPQDVYGENVMTGEAAVHAIYMLNRSDDGPRVRRLSINEAAEKVIHAHMFAHNHETGPQSVSIIMQILARTPVYELVTGNTPVMLGDWLVRYAAKHTAAN